jgi:hypothetical protein
MTDCRKKPKTKRPTFMTRLELRRSVSRRVDGLWIGSIEDKPEAGLRRVEEALHLIKSYDRRRYDRLIRDLERVWVRLIPGGLAQFDSSIWACLLDPRDLLDETRSPELIASWIVHEATHARLWRWGIGYQEELRSRVEAVCLRREQAFAAKLPDGALIREQADWKLSAYANQDYWTDEACRARMIEGYAGALQYVGMPSWFIKSMLAVRSPLQVMTRFCHSLSSKWGNRRPGKRIVARHRVGP